MVTILDVMIFVMALAGCLGILYSLYWKVQSHFSPELLSTFTPNNIFPATNGEEFLKITKLGKNISSSLKIVICALVRDVEDRIPFMKEKIGYLVHYFKDYRIIIVENDSKDKTREKLLEWSRENPKVIILGCGINSQFCSLNLPKTIGHSVDRARMEKMAYLRNEYLTFIKTNYYAWDYCMMWDLDIIGSVYTDGIFNSLGYLTTTPTINAMCAYGVYSVAGIPIYYDNFAHLGSGEKFNINHKTSHALKTSIANLKYQRGDSPIKVESCFSGFTIYRISSLIPSTIAYDVTPEEENNLECEHVRLNKKLGGVYMNPSMMNVVVLND